MGKRQTAPDTSCLLSAVKAAWDNEGMGSWHPGCAVTFSTNRRLRRGLSRLLAQPSEGPGGVKKKKSLTCH
jgi:hypothetical protein